MQRAVSWEPKFWFRFLASGDDGFVDHVWRAARQKALDELTSWEHELTEETFQSQMNL
jgi:hypothetical protein